MKIIEPSLLSINKDTALEQLKQIKTLGLDLVHYDVMDGKFVPATSFSTEYLKDLEQIGLQTHIHLMVQEPDQWIEVYRNYKVKAISFHVETQSLDQSKRIIQKLHDLGLLAGISVKPTTDLNQYKELLLSADIVMIMSVEPGKAGQSFVNEALKNLAIADEAKKTDPQLIIEIDGGINFDKIKELYNQVDWFVTGSWFFKNIGHMDQYLTEFKNLK